MPNITLLLGQAPAGNALNQLNQTTRDEYAVTGKRAHRLPLHAWVNELGFVRRVDSWKQNGSFDVVSYQFVGSNAPDNLHLAFYRLAPRKPEPDNQYGGYKSAYLKALEARWNEDHERPWEELARLVAQRQQQLEAALRASGWKTRSTELVTDARLIAGLGYEGPLEVGLSIHPLYGIPYLPGSSVKGVARALAEVVLKRQGTVSEARINEVFGSPDKDERRAEDFRLGCVRFFDAFPTQFPKLVVDVLTPHFIDYYMEKSLTPSWKEAPGDWHEPKPTAFLAVEENQPFRFLLAARAGDGFTETEAEQHLKDARDWLEEGLKALGSGGKTAAGYGYFATRDEREGAFRQLEDLADRLAQEEAELEKARQEEAEREARARIEAEAEAERQKEAELLAQGYQIGTVASIKMSRMQGKIQPQNGGDLIPFDLGDAAGVGSGDDVTFKVVERSGQHWATEVRKR